MKKRVLAAAAYLLPTFPLGFFWHLTIFADYYAGLRVFREQPLIPFGILAMIVQALLWSYIYERLFAAETMARGALRFFLLAFPLAWSFMVAAVAAKHVMTSVSGFVLIETAFLLLQYAIVSPLIAAVYSRRPA